MGLWKTNKEGTIAYKKFYDEISDRISIEFVKVKGHSGDKYNEIADVLAKKAAGVL
jgi:ribonuclease HI